MEEIDEEALTNSYPYYRILLGFIVRNENRKRKKC